jgi:hypothetical protein
MSEYRLEVAGPLPQGLGEEILRRFGPIEIHSEGTNTVLRGIDVDQAGLRALVQLVWEVGGDLLVLVNDDDVDKEHPG